MVRASQSGQTNESNSAWAGAARAYETDGDVVPTPHDRDNGSRAGTRTDEPKSKLPKGVGKLTFVPIDALHADPRNPRKHSRIQVRAIARSIDAFGFNAPILVDKRNQIIAGHGRYEAVKWPRAAGPFLAAAKLEVRLLVALYQAAKDSVCC